MLESQCNCANVSLTPLSSGGQSSVYIAQSKKNQKYVAKFTGRGKNLTEEEVILLVKNTLIYRSDLRKAHWVIPTLYNIHTHKDRSGYYIVTYEKYVDGKSLYEIPPKDLLSSTISLIETIAWSSARKVFIKDSPFNQLSVGVDLKPANVIASKAHTVLVDTFAPKNITKQGKWGIYLKKIDSLDQDDLMIVTGTIEGAILRYARLLECVTDDETVKRMLIAAMETSDMLSKESRVFLLRETTSGYPLLGKVYSAT